MLSMVLDDSEDGEDDLLAASQTSTESRADQFISAGQ